jgi:tRNA-modifying protein YgfZ
MNHCNPIQLDKLVYLRAHGADTDAFLQGQLSNDLRQLVAERAQLSSYNSAKGRMLAVLHLLRDAEGVTLEVHRDVADALLRRLRMFVLRARVTIEPATDRAAIGLLGADAPARLAALQLPTPDAPLAMACDTARGIGVMRRLGTQPRYSLHGSVEAIDGLRTQLGPAQAYAPWRRADIEAGVPVVYAATSDRFVPQMANLDRLGGISFDKGCYTGQEIVARLHYLGQLKRRMFAFRCDGPPPAPGTELRSDGSAAGEVVDAVDAADGGSLIGAVVQLAQLESGDLRLADGRALRRFESAAQAASASRR